jgi:AcrR family transcriptional regulator
VHLRPARERYCRGVVEPASRAWSQARTRSDLLRAGEAAYLESGFRGATANAIARRAGVSTGALYSNFESKEDLLLAVLDEHSALDAERLVVALEAAGSASESVGIVAQWLSSMVTDDARWRTLEVELAIASVGKPDLAERVRVRQRAYASGIAELLIANSARFGMPLPMPADVLGEALLALGDGLGVHSLVDPQIDARGVFARAMALLLGLGAQPA